MARSDQPKLHKLPVGSITPEGWLKDQLMLTNDLQKVLGARSDLLVHGAWVKGETLPRYIRGLILLAGVLGDEQLRDKGESYMSAIFDSANEGGDFGPSDSKYLCHKIEAVKTVLSYYELTGDEKALNFLRKFLKSTARKKPIGSEVLPRLCAQKPVTGSRWRASSLTANPSTERCLPRLWQGFTKP